MILAIYGTLRKDEYLHEYIDHYAKRFEHRMDEVELHGISIYVLGGVPGAKLDKDGSGIVELWEFKMSYHSEEGMLQMLDQVEGVGDGLYRRNHIDTPRGRAVIYTYCGRIRGLVKIKDWKEWAHSTTMVGEARALLEAVKDENFK